MDHHHLRSPNSSSHFGSGFGFPNGGFGRRRDYWTEREFGGMMNMMSMGGYGYGYGGMGRDSNRKEELVDVTYTDKLKKFIGDPFAEPVSQKTTLEE